MGEAPIAGRASASSRQPLPIAAAYPYVAGVAIWTWLLSFPFFGPLLGAAFGATAVVAGYTFSAGHAAGLLLWSLRRAPGRTPAALYALLAALTLAAFAGLPRAPALAIAAALGLASAGAVLGWVRQSAGSGRAADVLALAGAAANIVLWGFDLPQGGSDLRVPGGALMLAAVAILWWAQSRPSATAPPLPAPAPRAWGSPPAHLICFGLAAYAGGGVMYAALSPAAGALPITHILGVWPYIVAFYAAARWTDEGTLGRLVPWTLACLGGGFALLGAGSALPVLFVISWLAVNVGLGLADAYYWRSVLALAARSGEGGGVGAALAWNVVVVAGTALATEATRLARLALLPVAGSAAALVLFALVPVLTTWSRREPATGGAAAVAAPPAPEPLPPALGLTPAERRIFELLLSGSSDADIAAELHITRNTIKYHVRNVLRKAGCEDRRVLRARFGRPDTAAARPTGTPPPAARG